MTDIATIGANGARRHRKAKLLTLDDVDGRTLAAKNARALVAAIQNDVGQDLSAAERELAQRAGTLAAWLADCEARWISGQPFDVGVYCSATNTLRRLLEVLGVKRAPRDVSPSLEAYTRQLDVVAAK